jgi:RNA methyltransferase, TrmH family
MHENKYALVNDARDPRFLTLRSLQSPQRRSRTGLYLIEGIRHLAQALENHAPIHSVFYDPSTLSNRFGQKLVRRLRQSGVPGIQLSPNLYRQFTLAAEPQGIGAIVSQQWTRLNDLRVARDSCWLGVESLEQPGNLGTIIRTAEATGVNGIFVLGQNVDPWDPAAVRASMGSLFAQQLVRCSTREFADWAKSSGVAVVGSSPSGLVDYREWPSQRPTVLLVGNEKYGLSEHLVEVADFMVRIPMAGRCDSINVAVAAGVLLFEMFNQRRGRAKA